MSELPKWWLTRNNHHPTGLRRGDEGREVLAAELESYLNKLESLLPSPAEANEWSERKFGGTPISQKEVRVIIEARDYLMDQVTELRERLANAESSLPSPAVVEAVRKLRTALESIIDQAHFHDELMKGANCACEWPTTMGNIAEDALKDAIVDAWLLEAKGGAG